MNLTCPRELLLRGTALAAAVTPSRSTRPILAGVKLAVSGDETVVLATDLELAVRARIREVEVEEPGEVVLSAQTLVEILRTVESDRVQFVAAGRYCEIRARDAEFKLVTDDPAEFPEIPAPTEHTVTVLRSSLEELFQRTAFAAARDVGRYAINGVLVEVGEARLRFVATDGRRLALATRDLPDADFPLRRAIVPVKGLQECLRGSEGEISVRVTVDEQRVVFSSESADVIVKPVEGEFPDYAAVVPREHAGKLVVARDALLGGLRKASVVAHDAGQTPAVSLRMDDGRLLLSAQVEGRGEARTTLEVESEGADGFAADYNPDFLIEFLKAMPSQPVAFRFRDASGPGLFQLVDSADAYVVMPITTS